MKIPGTGNILLTALSLLIYAHAPAQTVDDRGMVLARMREIPSTVISDTVSVVFGGDFMMHRAQIKNSLRDGRHSFEGSFSNEVSGMLRDADLAVGNMEFSLGGRPYTGYPSFSAPETFPEYMADCGMDIFLLANNHILDKGSKGAERTVDYYRKMQEKRGIRFTGCAMDKESYESANPLYLRLAGIKVALVNFTYGTNAYAEGEYPKVSRMTRSGLAGLLGKARKEGAEIIIALPHWGPEYVLKASAGQKEWAQWLAEHGADLIIGTHPHVVQEADEVKTASGKTVPVVYSLGNAISNMSAKNTRIGLFVTMRLTRSPEGKAVILPLEYTYTWCTLPGRLSDRHMTIGVKEYEGRRSAWHMPYDYDNMMSTYWNIKKITGIQD